MSKKDNNNGLFLLGISIAVGLIISSLLFTDTLKFLKGDNQTITVKGYAEKKLVSDNAIWSGRFTTYNETKHIAYKLLEKDKEVVTKYLINNGIPKEKIKFDAVMVNEKYYFNDRGYSTGNVRGYNLIQNFSINMNNVTLIDELSRKSTELIKHGINFDSDNPRFYYTKLNDLKIEMLGYAANDAYERANILAKNSNSKVGRLVFAKQGVFQITSADSPDEVSDYGIYELSSINKTIKAIVTMEYTINNW